MPERCLVMVDIQNDFCPGGSLAVAEGDAVVPVANRLQPAFDLVVATQDWHPPDHASFAANHEGRQPFEVIEWRGMDQVLWPVHCVQDSEGAAFVPDLDLTRVDQVFRKGDDREIDSYSGFFDNGHEKATGLGDYLKDQGVREVYLVGIATDVCVKFTALDSRKLGFETYLVLDGCRGVDMNEGDVDRAVDEMRAAGVHVTDSGAVLAERRPA